MILFFTGLSGSGKTTIANEILKNYNNFILVDGDVLRQNLCSDLGFSDNDRKENLRRLIALCKLLDNNNLDVITSFIAPFEAVRIKAKEIKNLYIVYCNANLQECEKRDVKGLYKKARAGEIKSFTGIDSIYEVPVKPDVMLETGNKTIKECYTDIMKFIYEVKNEV